MFSKGDSLMVITRDFNLITFKKDDLEFKFLDTGDIFEIVKGNVMINLFRGNPKEGSLNNIYLRIYKDNKVFSAIPLLGIKSKSSLYKGDTSLMFKGEISEDSYYEVRFTLGDNSTWFYDIDVYGDGIEFDCLFLQDVGIGDKGAILTNELYTSQYIDHTSILGERGYVLCSRQNGSCGGKNPYVEHGCINGEVIYYSTDQMDFLGREYKYTGVPEYLHKDLPKRIYQFELSTIALQTKKVYLKNHERITFYGIFKDHSHEKSESLKYTKEVKERFNSISIYDDSFIDMKAPKIKEEFSGVLSSGVLSEDELFNMYKERNFCEYDDEGKLLSFFTDDHSHVVLMEKEILCERPHGHILITGFSKEDINYDVFSTTNYMYGIFNSHVVIGNTTLNKVMSVNRGLLNPLKNTGQRIYVKVDEVYRILTLPYAYEMGLNFSRWIYKIKDDILTIETFVPMDQRKCILKLNSKRNKKYDIIITNEIVMGEDERFNLNFHENSLTITPLDNSFLKNTYNDITYKMYFDSKFEVLDDGIFFSDGVKRDKNLIILKGEGLSDLTLSICGDLYGEEIKDSKGDLNKERDRFNNFYHDLLNGFNLSFGAPYDLSKINEIIYFYAHDALIHFSSPHGLEQSNGAAWGTRDVCQGGIEFFTSINNTNMVRKIILKVFEHQFYESGRWPQWFMFDKYNMGQDDSHGDIIFWPIKVLSEYILGTNDIYIFDEMVKYNEEGSKKECIFDHVKRALDNIKTRFIKGTYLINYDGGDWDDTLQPINSHLRENLISTWTMALAYETLSKLYRVLPKGDLRHEVLSMRDGILKDFNNYAIKDDVISGFLYLGDGDEIKYMLHPKDNITGIKYRLLSLTRSIIGEMVSLDQGKKNDKIIDDHLTFKDGVRLMDNTPKYNGGVSKIFKRAEEASNVGREISLEYVHAHIRYIESMCKIGEGHKAWEALFKILPINIRDSVGSADYRQSNVYFSSSDGDFNTRYDFEKRFNDLKDGSVKVKGGWRLYSSGPGIYINTLITSVLGVRYIRDKVILSPIIDKEMERIDFSYKILGRKVRIIYKWGEDSSIFLNNDEINADYEDNFYGVRFISIDKDYLYKKLCLDQNVIEVTLPM